MKKPQAKPASTSDTDLFLVGQLAAAISIGSFFYYLRHGDLLLYGDAVAHINIARRVFDSQTPGPLQLGTVWLPLPHILMMPFIVSRWMWQTAIGGAIPSMIAYLFSVIGVFLLVRGISGSTREAATFRKTGEKWGTPVSGEVRFAAWFAAAIFALNPNLIYLQTTAMTEPVYLAFFIWAVVFFVRALRACAAGDPKLGNSSLVKCGLCLLGGCLTRYDGWLFAAVLVAVGVGLARTGNFAPLRSGVRKLVLLAAIGPALWLAYNAAVYRNPLEFANGPYSAKAIEQKTSVPGTPAHPGAHDLPVAFRYFFKSAQLNLAPGKWQLFWVAALLLGTATALLFQRKQWPLIFLWVPVPFYMLSIAYSGVPLFVPVWWPFSHYNVRYGIEMLPAFAVFTAIAAYGLLRFAAGTKAKAAIVASFILFSVASYARVWRTDPVSYQEAAVNSRTRIALETQLASVLQALPANTKFLMYLGDHVGMLQQAGISLSRVINEGNHRPWMHPDDPGGLWEHALQHPASYADVVITFKGDPVAAKVNKSELVSVEILRVSGQPQATIYRTLKPG
jgi:hypothetical protein